jgi:FMN-dependent NADH-azoreductase
MKKLLEVQSSVRQENSISRTLSNQFIQTWKTAHPDVQHLIRDVGIDPPAHPTELWTKANYTAPEARTPEMIAALAHSEQLIAELLGADYLLLGVPMYNFSIPSNLKAYLDNVVRVGRTFAFDKETLTFEGLATGKKALAILPSASDYNPGTPMAQMDFCEPYLRTILDFIGIEEVTVVSVPNQFMPDAIRQQAIETARTKLKTIAATW